MNTIYILPVKYIYYPDEHTALSSILLQVNGFSIEPVWRNISKVPPQIRLSKSVCPAAQVSCQAINKADYLASYLFISSDCLYCCISFWSAAAVKVFQAIYVRMHDSKYQQLNFLLLLAATVSTDLMKFWSLRKDWHLVWGSWQWGGESVCGGKSKCA